MDQQQFHGPENRLTNVLERMAKAHFRYQPKLVEPKLVAVTKTFSAEDISPLLDMDQRLFGENRVQEAMGKWPALQEKYEGVKLHLIGPLQTNKVKEAVALFDVIETLDREKLAGALAKEMAKSGKQLDCFVQVNIGDEAQKSGIAQNEVVSFVQICRDTYGLNIVGLMCIPPAGDAPGPFFALMNGLAKEADVTHLSMGMSADFEVAIAMGASYVRVGSALFGNR